MRTLLPSRLLRTTNGALNIAAAKTVTSPSSRHCDPRACLRNCRCFAHVKDIDQLNREIWFTSTIPRLGDHQPTDERKLQLGKTVRTLHEKLPTLLQSPLPSDILSPSIILHLFPSTHPHFPTVSGRLAYSAALRTAPVAWGRVPLVGNVQLTILSERMVRNGGSAVPLASRDEKLIVKWKSTSKARQDDGTGGVYRGVGIGGKDPVDRIKEFISGSSGPLSPSARLGSSEEKEFCGIFVFEFDDEGRIAKHVIEHTEEGGHWDRMPKVVSVTDWLLGQFNGKKNQQMPELAWCEERPRSRALNLLNRRRGHD